MWKQNLEKITGLRHLLHQHPELSMQEKNTLPTIRRFLEENTSLEITDMGSWLYAVKAGIPGNTSAIAFRADVDALPIPETICLPYASVNTGISHKCGHDGHAAALCGLALELEGCTCQRDIILFFQPGEETGAGATICKDLIREKGISEIYAFHNLPGYPESSILYRNGITQPASEGIRVSFHGKTSHASAPEHGHNPAEAIARTVLFSQELPGQYANGMALCTVTGILLGNGDFGISPGDGTLSLTIRAEAESVMKQMERDLIDYTEKAAAMDGLAVTSDVFDYFPETRNHEDCTGKVIACTDALSLPCYEMKELWRASEDFGYYLKKCPGAMFYIGTGKDWPALHTEEYDFNDNIMETAVDMFLQLAKS